MQLQYTLAIAYCTPGKSRLTTVPDQVCCQEALAEIHRKRVFLIIHCSVIVDKGLASTDC